MLRNKPETVIGICYKSPNADKLEINELFAAIKSATQKEHLIYDLSWQTTVEDMMIKEEKARLTYINRWLNI